MSTYIYLDSSLIVRAYLKDESDHEQARALIENQDPATALVTGTWSKVEVAAALSRAGRHGRCNADQLLGVFASDISPDGTITVLSANQGAVEAKAIALVHEHALRALDALHLAVAELTLPAIAGDAELLGFATRDSDQANVARSLGYELF